MTSTVATLENPGMKICPTPKFKLLRPSQGSGVHLHGSLVSEQEIHSLRDSEQGGDETGRLWSHEQPPEEGLRHIHQSPNTRRTLVYHFGKRICSLCNPFKFQPVPKSRALRPSAPPWWTLPPPAT